MDVDQPIGESPSALVRSRPYSLINQKVDLDIGFDQHIEGTSHFTIFPETPDLKGIVLHARQCRITKITINGLKPDGVNYADPCDTLNLHTNGSVHQHHVISDKLYGSREVPPEPELVIVLPSQLKIEENPEFVVQTATGIKASKLGSIATNDAEAAEALADTAVSRYTRLEVEVSFTSIHTRDALQFACGAPGSGRWPHVYTRGGFLPGRASSLFPCIDQLYARCTWEISITGPRTVGDALREMYDEPPERLKEEPRAYEAKEMVFVCPGEITDDVISKTDHSRRTVSYAISQNISAQHIGFAIGPFEKVDLTMFRDAEKVELLQENAAPIFAYCLPGRKGEVEDTCLPTTGALDHFAIHYAPYPFTSFSYCFVDDHPDAVASFSGLALCSSRMLYSDDVIDPAKEVTRNLIQALTTQWLGIQIIPAKPEDTWIVLGAAIFIAELFMKELCGKNEYKYRMKMQSDRIVQLDHIRPSLWDMGNLLHVDPSEYDFMALKSPVVLYILDRRIKKTIGTPKMGISIGKFLSKARNEDLKDNLLSTEDFCKSMEKVLHSNINDFIDQWVKGAGCPMFSADQKFNKKKLVIEMSIRQVQGQYVRDENLNPELVMRDVREEYHNVYAAQARDVFTGPMTIRIHEADGTPYEHIIYIKDAVTRVDIPYNTKYKRLKRSKKQRAKNAGRGDGDEDQESLTYCLGDVLLDDEDVNAWRITEWNEEEEKQMNAESYEWIRLDADFEWIATMRISMPGHMFLSQLQQDKDVAAQVNSMQQIGTYGPGGLVSSIILRTMMDPRYFHGIRTMAAQRLVKHASDTTDMIGWFHLRKAFEELYCNKEGGSTMTRPNDFSDQLSYYLQRALIEAISKVRHDSGFAPDEVKHFLLDKLKFNDNSQNEFSDAYYVSTLLKGLTQALLDRAERPPEDDIDAMEMDDQIFWANQVKFEKSCLGEIDRYRRMDEWTSSYQNLYSRTALECQARLAEAGIGQFPKIHFLTYARPENYELLRCTAFDIVASMNLFENPQLLKLVVHGMVAATSPYVRMRLRQAFGRALARKAIGTRVRQISAAPVGQASESGATLQVEGAPATVQEPDKARRTTIEGALTALKTELGDNYVLQEALWQALTHPEAGYEDVKAMADFCQMIYEPQENGKVTLPLPRYWKIEMAGKGKLKFSRSNSVRRKRLELWQPKVAVSLGPRPALAQQAKTGLKLKMKRNESTAVRSNSIATTPTPPPQAQLGAAPAGVAQVAPKLKLKFRPSLPGQ